MRLDCLGEMEKRCMSDDRECYGDEPGFRLCFRLPKILFKSISTEPSSPWLRQIAIATERRFFYLAEDWEIDLISNRYTDFTGSIVIPVKTDERRFVFDGASIPVPWLISLITIGVFRPLGVLLIASIVHDFAFRYGYLLIRSSGDDVREIPIERHQADNLFREIVAVVNGNKVVGQLAWYFVRLGYWFCVRYNGQLRTGETPYLVGLSFSLFLGLFVFAVCYLGLSVVLTSSLVLYLCFYAVTLYKLGAGSTDEASTSRADP